jgi:hypothetical protein
MNLPIVPLLFVLAMTIPFFFARRRLAARGPFFVWGGFGVVLVALALFVYSMLFPS